MISEFLLSKNLYTFFWTRAAFREYRKKEERESESETFFVLKGTHALLLTRGFHK